MSKKNQRQRRTSAGKSVTMSPVAKAVDNLFEQTLAELWAALHAGDLLRAEVAIGGCAALPRLLGLSSDETDTTFIKLAAQSRTTEDAALLRLLALLGSSSVKRSASRALADLTASGVYPAEWVAEAGKAAPGRAWRRLETLGDGETIIVTYRYGDSEHAFRVSINLAAVPVVSDISLLTDTADLVDEIKRPASGFEAAEEITLAEARWHLETAMKGEATIANTVEDLDLDLDHRAIGLLPVVRSRLRRLPAAEPAKVFTAADRAAAVDEFMASPQAAGAIAVDEEATRFWAQLLTAYSSRLPGEPPTQVGPRKLDLMLGSFAPNTYPLTEAQRRHMRPAVTAWVRWSAAYRALDETATELLTSDLPEALDVFDAVYDGPVSAAVRAYTSDVATSEADVSWIAEHGTRRCFAIPPPGKRDDSELTDVQDAGDPAVRRAYAEAEFGDCVPDGQTREEFLAAAQGVIEELWLGEPADTWEQAQRLTADGIDRHDVIHSLIRQTASSPRP